MNLQDLNQITTPEGGRKKLSTKTKGLAHNCSKGKVFLAVAVLACVSCVTVLSANTIHRYYNETLVADEPAMRADVAQKDPDHYGYSSPNGSAAYSKEEIMASRLEHQETWTTDTKIGASISPRIGQLELHAGRHQRRPGLGTSHLRCQRKHKDRMDFGHTVASPEGASGICVLEPNLVGGTV